MCPDPVITSPDNQRLKQVRKLAGRRERGRTGLFVAEGEDLIAAATRAGWTPEVLLRSAREDTQAPDWLPEHADVEPGLLDRVSALGSGSELIGIYEQRWAAPSGLLSVYLHAVGDPGNVGTVLRGAHGLCDGPVVLGPDCADPYSPKAVRAAMGSVFARPPARARVTALPGTKVALDGAADASLGEVAQSVGVPVVLCVGAEREGLPAEVLEAVDLRASIPMRGDGPDSLNAAMAATVALYELANRILAR